MFIFSFKRKTTRQRFPLSSLLLNIVWKSQLGYRDKRVDKWYTDGEKGNITIKTIKTFKTITIRLTSDNGDLNQYGDRDGEKMDLRGRNQKQQSMEMD